MRAYACDSGSGHQWKGVRPRARLSLVELPSISVEQRLLHHVVGCAILNGWLLLLQDCGGCFLVGKGL
jgi:hypothetical protein